MCNFRARICASLSIGDWSLESLCEWLSGYLIPFTYTRVYNKATVSSSSRREKLLCNRIVCLCLVLYFLLLFICSFGGLVQHFYDHICVLHPHQLRVPFFGFISTKRSIAGVNFAGGFKSIKSEDGEQIDAKSGYKYLILKANSLPWRGKMPRSQQTSRAKNDVTSLKHILHVMGLSSLYLFQT